MSVVDIQQRIASIQQRFAITAPPTAAAPTAPSAPGTPPTDFRALLGQALGLPGAAGARGAASTAGWHRRLPAAAQPYAGLIEQAAERAGVDPQLVAAVAWQESGFQPAARSAAGALGLMQLMPGTARELGVDPLNPAANLEGGARYLAQQLARFGGRTDLALAAYNAGPGRVAAAGGVPAIPETQAYVRAVTEHLRHLTSGAAVPTP